MMILMYQVSFSSPADTTAKAPANRIIYSFRLAGTFDGLDYVPMDTSLRLFHIYHPGYIQSISCAQLGNIGSAVQHTLFFLRPETDFLFNRSYSDYFFTPGEVQYYNTKRPFTRLNVTLGQKKEQTINVLHTQNVNEHFNFGLMYYMIASDGMYLQQKTADGSFVLFSSYQNQRYSLFANASFSKCKVFQNGGISDDSYVEDSSVRVNQIPFNINANTYVYNRNFFITQQYRFGRKIVLQDTAGIVTDSLPSGDTLALTNTASKKHEPLFIPYVSLIHTFRYSKDDHLYKHDAVDTSFYRHVFIDSVRTYDSVSVKTFQNILQLSLVENPARFIPFGLSVRAGYDLYRLYYFDTTKYAHDNLYYLSGFFRDSMITDTYVSAGLFQRQGKRWNWEINGEYHPEGYFKKDYRITSHLKKQFLLFPDTPFVSVYIKYLCQTPDFFEQNYYSNHFAWKNAFPAMEKTQGGITFYKPSFHLMLTVEAAAIRNFIYFDTAAMPAIESEAFNIYAAGLHKDFQFRHWHTIHKIIYQSSGNPDVLPLPEIATYHALYYENNMRFDFTKGEIQYQIGSEVFYNTAFYACAFMPATSQFYIQKEKRLGNYPYISLYVNVKLKRFRFFVKGEHLNSGLIEKKYFTTLHYPMNVRAVRFGVSWTFYN